MSKLHKGFGATLGPLNFPVSDNEARELEKDLDTGDWGSFKFKKSDSFESLNPGERSDISVITDSSIDLVGDVIDHATIDFTKFQKNPVVAWDHDYTIAPIGKSLWQKQVAGGVWKAKTRYLSRPKSLPEESEWVPDTILSMMLQGSLTGKSVGGAVKWRDPTQADADRLGFELNKCNRISEKAVVYEYSVTPHNANPNAIVEQVTKGLYSIPATLIKSFEGLSELLEKNEDELITIDYVGSVDDFIANKRMELRKRVHDVLNNTDTVVEAVIKRKQGKVE